jgi:hypothetical protein
MGHAYITVTAHTYADHFDDVFDNIAAALDSLEKVSRGSDDCLASDVSIDAGPLDVLITSSAADKPGFRSRFVAPRHVETAREQVLSHN